MSVCGYVEGLRLDEAMHPLTLMATGIYGNVNPTVDHPRWSQASERPIGGGLFAKRQPTLMFNGYEIEVAPMYNGLDLRKHY